MSTGCSFGLASPPSGKRVVEQATSPALDDEGLVPQERSMDVRRSPAPGSFTRGSWCCHMQPQSVSREEPRRGRTPAGLDR
jgi:hypothetical protein